jgi:hypothetical protein
LGSNSRASPRCSRSTTSSSAKVSARAPVWALSRQRAHMGIDAHVGPVAAGLAARGRMRRARDASVDRRRPRRVVVAERRRRRLAAPQTISDWLRRDERGDVPSGPDLARAQRGDPSQAASLETSQAGSFVAGDVRHSSVKRVASAVGEGPMAVPSLTNPSHPSTTLAFACQRHVSTSRPNVTSTVFSCDRRTA